MKLPINCHSLFQPAFSDNFINFFHSSLLSAAADQEVYCHAGFAAENTTTTNCIEVTASDFNDSSEATMRPVDGWGNR